MLILGPKLFSAGAIAPKVSASVPFRGSLDCSNGDCFVRSKDAGNSTKDSILNSVSKNEIRYLKEDAKYLGDAKAILESTPFVFKDGDEEFEGTLREYFENSRTGEAKIPMFEFYHGTTKESVDSMLRGGLDYTKTGRNKCGPGTYFVPSQAAAMIFGGSFLEARYRGDQKIMPRFKESFFEPVESHKDIQETLASELGVSESTASKLLKVCAHDILVNDMGIDALWSSSGYSSGAYFVVLNDDCMRLSRG